MKSTGCQPVGRTLPDLDLSQGPGHVRLGSSSTWAMPRQPEDTITCPAFERSSAWQPSEREPAASTRQGQAVTAAYASRAVWIIRVFLFLILESTLSYVRQLEARVRQLEEENRVLPQVGDFCCGNSSRQLDSSAEGLVLEISSVSLGAAASERSHWSSGESKTRLLFVLLGTEWGIYWRLWQYFMHFSPLRVLISC